MSDADDTGTADFKPGLDSEEDGLDVAQTPDELVEGATTPEEPEEQAHPQAAVTTAPESADAALVEAVSGGLTWIPFAVYLGLWFVLAGLSAYLLYGAGPDQPARWMPIYEPLLWAGVVLAILGPVLSIIVWLIARTRRPKSARRGLFASAMTRGALAAFFGVLVWVSTLFVLELVSSGWTL